MKKPNFFIAGVSKCGTTSLHNYMDLHPDVFMSGTKEPHYFIKDILEFPHKGPGDRQRKNIVDSIEEYRELFQDVTHEKIVGESSADYLYYSDSAEKIKAYSPDAKIVFILRNPVDRAYSAYTHLTRDGRETKEFEYALEKEEERKRNNYGCLWHLKSMGLYFSSLKHFMDVFGEGNIKVIISEEFKRDSHKVLNEICDFLNIDHFDEEKLNLMNYNVSGIPKNKKLFSLLRNKTVTSVVKIFVSDSEKRENLKNLLYSRLLKKENINPATREKLIDYFYSDIKKLEELLDTSLDHWLK